ncbi:glycosyltransferase [Ideonella azotifigens]|uniref:Glycosyltransferase n=2 Tax=Ideonella azotifigens TaxID=513160 RepID=A0ABN1JIL1_9BURK|nr:glycosyltransferase [Ideonella azotifigens]MCD2342058.1 glycosyltransferase [Ideonella azotifigens]
MPKVTLISAFYNRAAVVERTVAGLQRQTFADFEAHLIDDASKDGTLGELLKHASQKLLVHTQPNMGFVNTMISAIARTDSEYIAVLGSGDECLPERLAKQVAYLDAHPDVGVVGCHSEIVFESGGATEHWRPEVQADVKQQLFHGNPFIHGDVMMRRSAYEQAGGYRAFFTYRQDLDLWLRISDHARLAVLPEVLYRCYKLKQSVSEDVRKLIVAMTCRDFAVYCARERLAGRPDPLQAGGPVAALMRPRSRALAEDLAYAAQRRALRGERTDAALLVAAALREHGGAKVRMAQVMVHLPGLVQARALVRGVKRQWAQVRPGLNTARG